jgi:excisionase family DNA binding protein
MTIRNQLGSELSIKHLPTDPLLTTSETAAYLGVTEGTISVWRCTRRYPIPYIKIGRLVKYRKSALDAFLAQRTIGASTSIHEGGLS